MPEIMYNEDKLRELLVYVAERLHSDRTGGAGKLSNALYFADFAHMRCAGRPITGAAYERLPQGPVPRRLLPVRDALVAAGDAEIVRETFLGYEQPRLLPKRTADTSLFSKRELTTVDAVIDDLRGLTSKQVSDLAQAEPGWNLVEEGETIPYAAALIAPRHVETAESQRLTRAVAERHGVALAQ